MSDLCMYEFEDTVWDEFCRSDDHIVPLAAFERADEHSILYGTDTRKKSLREATSLSSDTGDKSGARYVDQAREEVGFSSLSKRRNTMLEKDSWAHSQSGSASNKEASSLASNSGKPPSGFKNNNADLSNSGFSIHDTVLSDKTNSVDKNSFSYPLDVVPHAGNNLDFFKNNEDKDSNDFLYDGWPEIGNFEDVDKMFRSCDSTFGLGPSKEDELDWLSSADNIGGPGVAPNSDFKFLSHEPNLVEHISENHDSSKMYSLNDSSMTSDAIRLKEGSWATENSDSYISFVNGPAAAGDKEGFAPEKKISENRKQVKLQNQSTGKRKEHSYGNGSMSNLSSEVVQQPSRLTSLQTLTSPNTQQQLQAPDSDSYCYLPDPIAYTHSENSHLSGSTLLDPRPSAVKSEADDLTSNSRRDSCHASSQVQSIETNRTSALQASALAASGKKEKLHNRQANRSSPNSSLKNASDMVHGSICDPGLVGKQIQFSGEKYEANCEVQGISYVPVELSSSNVRESSTRSSAFSDGSLEAAGFRQLQHVMEQLDLRTKLCIRDSLYRLARSAEQRHNHANLRGSCGEEREDSGAFMAEGSNNFMDLETDTNPIDRSIAHLLFHRPAESSATPFRDSITLKTHEVVHGSGTGPPMMVENFVIREVPASDME